MARQESTAEKTWEGTAEKTPASKVPSRHCSCSCKSWLSSRQCPLEWLVERQRGLYGCSLRVICGISIVYALTFVSHVRSFGETAHMSLGLVLCPLGSAFLAGAAYLLLAVCKLSACARAAVFVMALGCINICYCFVPIFSEEAQFRTRSLAITMSTWKAVPALFGFNRVMAAIYLTISFLADYAAHALNEKVNEDEFPTKMLPTLLLPAIGWFFISMGAQSQLRKVFEMERDLLEDVEPFRDMLAMFCDAAIWIFRDALDDGSYKVFSSDGCFDAMIGDKMDGRDIADVIAHENQAPGRLVSALERSHTMPVALPVTLIAAHETVMANMYIVGRRSWSIIDKLRERGLVIPSSEPCWTYLVGFQIIHFSSVEGAEPEAALPASAARWARTMAVAVEEADEDGDPRTGNQPAASVRDDRSMPDTTASGQVFKEADRLFDAPSEIATKDNVMTTLKKLERLGKRQGWLLDADDIIVHLDQILGAGAFGAVVAATMHGTAVAIKFPKNEGDGLRKKDLGSLVNEMRILRHVRHPNIVSFYGACVVPGGSEVSLVLERVYGVQLIEYLRQPSPNAEKDRFTLMVDVACALRYLHAQRPAVVHGDLKGSNILVETTHCRAKLIDFGLARLLTRHAKTMGGSFSTVAPEILADPTCVPTTCSDVFSFGRVAYLIVTGGRLPLEGLGPQFIQEMAKQGKPIPLKWPTEGLLITECEALLEEAMLVSKHERPSMAHIHEIAGRWRAEVFSRGSAETSGQYSRPASAGKATDESTTGDASSTESLESSGFSESCLSIVRTSLVKPSGSSIKSGGRLAQQGTPAVASWDKIMEPGDKLQGPLANRAFRATRRWAKEITLRDVLSTWNVSLPTNRCCDMHGGLAEVERVLKRLQTGPCEASYSPLGDWQCPSCGLLYNIDEVEEPWSNKCAFCIGVVSQQADGSAAPPKTLAKPSREERSPSPALSPNSTFKATEL
eukprot:TRINITY_DN3293_c0_g1_i3.p1 TRINITY_DN3293_c0_g1~~TRINITY_DN3293_c0_g1_i3.p1  ORF type:complete len:966 (-),score=127.21 TRINITY_DN3293_c0_g1_i3:300-3197(-)